MYGKMWYGYRYVQCSLIFLKNIIRGLEMLIVIVSNKATFGRLIRL